MALGIRLSSSYERVSWYQLQKVIKSYVRVLEGSGQYRHYRSGYQEYALENTDACFVSADRLDHLLGADQVRESLQSADFCVASTPTVLESGAVVAIAANQAFSPPRQGCIFAEAAGELSAQPGSHWHVLPGPPETTYHVATGLSHAILFSQSPNPGFNQVLGLGDNRHRAALPRTAECRQPPKHLLEPRCIEDLCGIAISGISAGGSRSAAWSEAGEGWIWGKGIEGIEKVELPTSQDTGEIAEGDGLSAISQIAVGDGYEFVLAQNGTVWTRGNSTYGLSITR